MRRTTTFALLGGIRVALLISSGLAQDVTFANAPLGVTPRDFEAMQTGPGKPGRWEVVGDSSASGGKAVAQLSQDTTVNRFPLLIYMPTVPADVEVRTKVKPVAWPSPRFTVRFAVVL